MPAMDPDHRTEEAPLAGDPPNPINPPSGCRFHPRCALAAPVCSQRVPQPLVAGGAPMPWPAWCTSPAAATRWPPPCMKAA